MSPLRRLLDSKESANAWSLCRPEVRERMLAVADEKLTEIRVAEWLHWCTCWAVGQA